MRKRSQVGNKWKKAFGWASTWVLRVSARSRCQKLDLCLGRAPSHLLAAATACAMSRIRKSGGAPPTSACRGALANLHSRRIAGLAVDGTSGTILLTNSSGDALTIGLMYDDLRARKETHSVNETGGAIWAALGYHMQPSWALPKLLWLLHEHRNSVPGARLTHQADFINRRLAGCEVPSDSSNALKTGYDFINESWPYDVLEALGVPEEIMPEVVRSGTQIGTVCADAAVATGIPVGTPIIAGMTDGCAAQIGAGALDVGSWNVVLGTTMVLKGVTNQLILDPGGALYSHRSPDGYWLPGGASNTGAGVFANRFPGRNLDTLGSQAAERSRWISSPILSPAGANGFLLSHPPRKGLFWGMHRATFACTQRCFKE